MNKPHRKNSKKNSGGERAKGNSNQTSKKSSKAPLKTSHSLKKESNQNEIRLNKYIANSGVCSRRDADMHIAIGSVTVNGKVITEMGYKVLLIDEVRFDGALINPEKKAYILLNKPKGFASTTMLNQGKSVMDLVANATPSRIKPIGKLPRSATGLLFFTNDEAVVNKFTNSKKKIYCIFQLSLDKKLKYEDFKHIQSGIKVDRKIISVEEINYIEGEDKDEIGIKIKHPGVKTIKSIFEHLKYEILQLDCVSIGFLTKKDLPRGHWKHLSELEVNNLKML